MKLSQRVKNAYIALAGQKQKNSVRNPANDFLRYGNRLSPMMQDWSQVEMSDEDMYTGYPYAAITKRAHRTAILGKNFLYTKAADPITEAAKQKEKEIVHPYLPLISGSREFSENGFWQEISTYLDLEGVYYLMAVRAVSENDENEDKVKKVGAIQKFILLNSYEIRRVIKESDGTLGGYIESHDGMYREIPPEMIIEIKKLNPFQKELPYSMTDAAKESQFTMKQAGDYTRHSIRGNINSPGAITTDVVLEDQIFDNFVSRIQNHSKGEPLFGNGAGAINWQAMQIDLDNAALDKINDIHRSILFAVSGVSKTMMGQEESGTGREVSKTLKDDFTENAVMPQVETIIDALNLDYRKYYPEWEKDQYEICLDNPLESDREAELKDIEIRTKEYEIVNKLQSLGYEYELAARYAIGEISLEELGEPTLEPELTDEEADAIAEREIGVRPAEGNSEPENGNEVSDMKRDVANKVDSHFLVQNAKGDRFNPYRDTKGKFDDGITLAERRKMGKKEDNEKKLEEARKRAKTKLSDQKKAEKEKVRKEREAKKAEKSSFKKDGLKSTSGTVDMGSKKPDKAQQYLSELYGEDPFDNNERKAVDGYANTNFASINGGLRRTKDGQVDSKQFVDSSLIKTIEMLDSAFGKTKTKETTITYRGIDNGQNKELTVGSIIQDQGYSSTSMTKQSAEGFLGEGDNPYMMRITIPKGHNVVLPSLSESASSTVAHESEILLPRNTAYKVEKVTEETDSLGYTYNLVEVSIV